ncbi:hypothetical protein [Brevibacillus invocatus]|uniref:hypothetical protein n=1 Tax=Brevibacillus invocatus TaxID=173959 RepID=UPI00203C88C4|nr:hypothetical protein [Brevibacillus invocatus]MCM3079583.1 hypothetical protein [Brevibacillus invocatus]MCM3429781.1 hypothetical protein [Brevibacillus invocatus]
MTKRKIQDYISKKIIRLWLDNYTAVAAGDRLDSTKPHNSGPKPVDGIMPGRINLIMLNGAIESLSQELKAVVYSRWINKLPLEQALKIFGMQKAEYLSACDQAVDDIYYQVNGGATITKGALSLVDAIFRS